MPDSLETGLTLTLIEQVGDKRRCRQARTARMAGQALAQRLQIATAAAGCGLAPRLPP